MDKKRVVVALSGGLDSAAAALRLLDLGYVVEGVHFWVNDDPSGVSLAERNACWLGIPLTVLDLRVEFRSCVVDYFLGELRLGRTPAPCSFCNPRFKWYHLAEFADRVGADYFAMGHYVRQLKVDGEWFIRRGVDPAKDQSYYLWDLSQDILSRALFPLGDMTKAEVRDYLSGRGYSEISRTRESMGLCFLPSGVSYRDFVFACLSPSSGDVVDLEGRVIGSHSGALLYTIGQRRGFDIFEEYLTEGVVWVVLALDTLANRLIVGCDVSDQYVHSFVLDSWRLSDRAFVDGCSLTIMVRGLGRNPRGGASFEVLDDGGL
ncbi:MAG: tRNA methyl transferase PRC-barrel domain-containing protein, partial [Rikenellaceae bacterium]